MKSDKGAGKCHQSSISAVEIEQFVIKKIHAYLSEHRLAEKVLDFVVREYTHGCIRDWEVLTTKQKCLILHHIVEYLEFNGDEGVIRVFFQKILSGNLKNRLDKKNSLELRFHFVTKPHGQKKWLLAFKNRHHRKIRVESNVLRD